MQYRHSFHAGNFADVHKHVALLALLGSLQKKPKGLLYLDTHAGGGLYDLRGDESRRGAESQSGIERLQAATPHSSEIAGYLAAIAALRGRFDGGAHLYPGSPTPPRYSASQHLYPGSPLLAGHALRNVDRGVCIETVAQESRLLERTLRDAALSAAVRVEHGDGYERMGGLLPPPERRALVLVDPPYENADEHDRILQGLVTALTRFPTGVFAVWFPVKRQRDCDNWLAKIGRHVTRPTLAAMLWLHPRDSAVALNGSGMLIVNPPWQIDAACAIWQEELRQLLGGDGNSGSEVRWLVHERA